MKAGFILLAISFILFAITFIDFCTVCQGWNIINPLCQLSYASCVIQEKLLKLTLQIGAGLLFLVSLIVLLKGK